MHTRSLRSTKRIRVALLAIAAVVATASVTAAEVEKKPAESQAEIEKKLEDARRRLDVAAREVAELSMSMSENSVPSMRPFAAFGPPRALLGINLGPRGEEPAEGVPVLSVSPGGAAESAGLKAGDVLLAIGDKQLKRDGEQSPREVLLNELGNVKPGEKVQIKYRRDNKVATVAVTPQAPDRLFAVPPVAMRGKFAGGGPGFAVSPLASMRAVGVFGSTELVPLTPKLGQYFGTEKGLLVVRAPSDSRLKLEDGDVIVDIDGRTPANPSHAFRILGSYQAGEKLTLNVLRQKKKVSFDITVPDDPIGARSGPMIFEHRLDGPEGPGGPGPRGPNGPRGNIIIGPGPGPGSAVPLPPPPPGGPERGLSIVIDEPA
ncbi:PDZ domain-containing protein [Steroidobacter sp.]|uniref:PDZ domain-containing protein n=1 Tax=Steroidobacter sp. TaxID=1978227 RepID=UPI001A5E62BF|nr:PDZ domain-containing protein [Steroidobacter sp.]MBL8268908.1 PDZ domain-containing protein [Steroidobacter sp.]